MTLELRISVVGENPTETDEYKLERQATTLKQAGDLTGAIDCLKQAQAIRGPLESDTRLAKYLQQAGRFDEAMQEIQDLLDGSHERVETSLSHQPRSVRRCAQASWLALLHKDAALLCKREKRKELQLHHDAESERWWAINQKLKPVADQDKKSMWQQYEEAKSNGAVAMAEFSDKRQKGMF